MATITLSDHDRPSQLQDASKVEIDAEGFTRLVAQMTPTDIALVASNLRSATSTVAGEMAWWKATLSIARALRQSRRVRMAACAALLTSRSVLRVAHVPEMATPNAEVILVARAASDIARGLVAGEAAHPGVMHLLRPWQPLLVTDAAA